MLDKFNYCRLIAGEEVAGVDFFGDVVEFFRHSVCYYGAGEVFELSEVVDNAAAEESGAVFKGRLVDYDLRALCLDALHDALDRGLPEVVGIGLHGQAVDSYHTVFFVCGSEGVLLRVVVPSCHFEYPVGDEVLAGAVALNDCRHHALRHISIVGEQLLGILWKAIAAVAK